MVNNNMEHFYTQVEGFMNHRNTIMLDFAIGKFPAGGRWVELGSWMGRSAAYCVVELINANKLGEFYCIDTWDGGIEHQGWQELDRLRASFDSYTRPIASHITAIQSDSWLAADQFEDNSVDFCYVDAGHTYDCVTRDLKAWWPKVKTGCYFGGDDYTKGWPQVCRAVEDFFAPQKIKVSKSGRCWIVKKTQGSA